jgi:hypothetical protein
MISSFLKIAPSLSSDQNSRHSSRISLFLLTMLTVIFAIPLAAVKTSVFANESNEIQARQFGVSIVRPSKSNRVYLIKVSDSKDLLPVPGKIILLRTEATPVMGFRVLKNYQGQQFAAKKIKTYSGHEQLSPGFFFSAYEKTGDPVVVTTETVSERQQDASDLKELDPNAGNTGFAVPQVTPPSLPAPTTPEVTPTSEASPTPEAPPSSDEEAILRMLEETDTAPTLPEEEPRHDYYPWSMSFSVGLLKNKAISSSQYFPGAGIKFAYHLADRTFFDQYPTIDTLSIEGSVFYHNILLGDADNARSYILTPLGVTINYTVKISKKTSLGVYGGVLYQRLHSYTNLTSEDLTNYRAKALTPAAGLLMQYEFGPNWSLRADLGIDQMSAGIMVNF